MRRLLLLVIVLAHAASARDRIAYIEFYGYQGLDLVAIRKALPVHEGDALTSGSRGRIKDAIQRVTGRKPDIGLTCCVGDGDSFLTVGLRGGSPPRGIRPAPKEKVTMSPDVVALSDAMDNAEAAAMQKGASMEDGAPGYRLMKDPGARAAELKVRDYALGHEAELLRVLQSASDSTQREMASDILGFGAPTPQRTAAFVDAMRDPDSHVRNNAIRALWEMVGADPAIAAHISADPLIDLICTGTASDLNKSTLLLTELTRTRDPQLLARLKAEAWDALMEFARWRVVGWAYGPRIILARIAGFDEERAGKLAEGPLEEFLAAVHR